MAESHCVRCFVSGRVQGVWYRDSTRQKATELGLRGFAKNLPDGRVEVLACGSEAALAALERWLWQGPQHARVQHVEHESLPGCSSPKGFEVL